MIFHRNKLTPRNGGIYVDVYSYVVRECIRKKEPLIIKVGDKKMEVPFERLRDYEKLTTKRFKSQYGGQNYTLCSYKWRADNPKTIDQKLELLSKQCL